MSSQICTQAPLIILFVFFNKNVPPSPAVHYTNLDSTFMSNALYSNRIGIAKENSFMLWHSRLGHPSSLVVHKVLQFCNVPSDENKISAICDACCLGKHHQLPFTTTSVYSEPLELIYSDIWGPCPLNSTSSARDYITFMDAYSKHI